MAELADLRKRCERGVANLRLMANDPRVQPQERIRLNGKASGLELAVSYIREAESVPVTEYADSAPVHSDRDINGDCCDPPCSPIWPE